MSVPPALMGGGGSAIGPSPMGGTGGPPGPGGTDEALKVLTMLQQSPDGETPALKAAEDALIDVGTKVGMAYSRIQMRSSKAAQRLSKAQADIQSARQNLQAAKEALAAETSGPLPGPPDLGLGMTPQPSPMG